MPNPSGLGIRSYGATDEYRDGHDRIFGKREGESPPRLRQTMRHLDAARTLFYDGVRAGEAGGDLSGKPDEALERFWAEWEPAPSSDPATPPAEMTEQE